MNSSSWDQLTIAGAQAIEGTPPLIEGLEEWLALCGRKVRQDRPKPSDEFIDACDRIVSHEFAKHRTPA
jgi:hypothetical protein